MGGEQPEGWTELTAEQATPADELEVAEAAADLEPGNYPLVVRNPDTSALLVAVHNDGSITYGEGYDPDEAARAFWIAVGAATPDSLKTTEE